MFVTWIIDWSILASKISLVRNDWFTLNGKPSKFDYFRYILDSTVWNFLTLSNFLCFRTQKLKMTCLFDHCANLRTNDDMDNHSSQKVFYAFLLVASLNRHKILAQNYYHENAFRPEWLHKYGLKQDRNCLLWDRKDPWKFNFRIIFASKRNAMSIFSESSKTVRIFDFNSFVKSYRICSIQRLFTWIVCWF